MRAPSVGGDAVRRGCSARAGSERGWAVVYRTGRQERRVTPSEDGLSGRPGGCVRSCVATCSILHVRDQHRPGHQDRHQPGGPGGERLVGRRVGVFRPPEFQAFLAPQLPARQGRRDALRPREERTRRLVLRRQLREAGRSVAAVGGGCRNGGQLAFARARRGGFRCCQPGRVLEPHGWRRESRRTGRRYRLGERDRQRHFALGASGHRRGRTRAGAQ